MDSTTTLREKLRELVEQGYDSKEVYDEEASEEELKVAVARLTKEKILKEYEKMFLGMSSITGWYFEKEGVLKSGGGLEFYLWCKKWVDVEGVLKFMGK